MNDVEDSECLCFSLDVLLIVAVGSNECGEKY
jgi:hypothetical protein